MRPNRVGDNTRRRARDNVGAREISRRHQHRAAALRRHRGEHRVDIFGGDQRDVREHRAHRVARRRCEHTGVASATAAFRPRGYSSSIAIAPAPRASASSPGSDDHHRDMVGAARAKSRREDVAKHRLSERGPLAGGKIRREPGLGEC